MTRKSVFAIFIGFEVEITGKILKTRLMFSKNIIEIVRLPYNFSKLEIWDTNIYFEHARSLKSLSYDIA